LSPTPCSASIEWACDHAGVIRLHPHEGGKVGDPYEWSAFVVRTGPESAEIRGVDRPISKAGGRAVCRALAEHGIYRRHHLRREDDGVFRVVERPTDPRERPL
jgi:hypothetical protein